MNRFIDNLLGFLETRESRLLSWGFYDSSMTSNDIAGLLQAEGGPELLADWKKIEDEGGVLEDVLDLMEQANLMYAAEHQPTCYRTRFAEGLRLIARLKQLFRENQWSNGPNLVSDIKLHLTPRRYPRRDRSPDMCWSDLGDALQDPVLQRELFEALCRDRGGKEYFFAGFQSRAFRRILASYGKPGVTGTIVSAGTGSGKTKAFYVPAFLACATELRLPASTKIIAVYPRNVLLADQLREAMSEADKLRSILLRRGLRPIRFGALLGSTPHDGVRQKPDTLSGKFLRWERRGKGYVIPYLKSPLAPDQELMWREADIRSGNTRLYRADGSKEEPDIADGVLAITREDIMRNPPDVLFLSLEMLNKELGNPNWSRAFGIGTNVAPRLLLLDEIHAYEGVHGAQIAWVLRRWRHATRRTSLHVVGLSATLKEATAHLSKVAGIRPENVHEFRPLPDEMVSEGMEYNLAVKGASAAGTTLLSTTLQTGMVLSRLLTPRSQPRTPPDAPIAPENYYGQTVFGFTDNLDGVNRWLSDMTDAERRRLARLRLHPRFQQPPPAPMPDPTELWRRDQLGQLWELPRRLGHDLLQPLRVARCSSQDPGADVSADMIIATSSLEVGYDDPRVGAVIQHKRPVSTASFLQRKGRAGRRRGTRPWTVVILSDYGADRWAFQQAEQLFEPELTSLNLPLHNPYVLRIQATFFLLDWLGRRVGASPFEILRPGAYHRSTQLRIAGILLEMLRQGAAWSDFRIEMEKLFGRGISPLSEPDIDNVLWELPRPVLRQVIPTLLRQLESSWAIADPSRTGEDESSTRPLPGYLPKATFSELGGADVNLTLVRPGVDNQQEEVGVEQALFETCVGRVSKRYSTAVNEPGFWHVASPQLTGGDVHQPIQTVYPVRLDLGRYNGVRVFQPIGCQLTHRPPQILDSSFASWNWDNVLYPRGQGLALPLFRSDPWLRAVEDVTAFLHRDQSSIEVVRYAETADYETRRRQADPLRGRLTLCEDEPSHERQAAGFRLLVDGIRIRLKREHLQLVPDRNQALEASFRADYYLECLQASPTIRNRTSIFMAGWIWQISLAMLTATAAKNRCTLEEAQDLLRARRSTAAEHVLRTIFQVQGANGDDGRLVDELRDLWGETEIVDEVQRLETCLWAAKGSEYDQWIRRRYVATIAQSFRATAVGTQADVSEEDLAVDVVWLTDGSAEVYLTETQTGGLGQIETIVQHIRKDPSQFLDGFERTLGFCPRAEVVSLLQDSVSAVASPQQRPDLAAAFVDVRQSRDFHACERAKDRLRRALDDGGFPNTRSAVFSVVTRILRPGSSVTTDSFSYVLNALWHRFEERIGLAVDPRVFAYCVVSRPPGHRRLASYLTDLSGGTVPTTNQVYAAVQELLFEGCRTSCPECLDQPNRYNDFGRPARDLAKLWLDLGVEVVVWESDAAKWMQSARAVLQRRGKVRLVVPIGDIAALADQLPQFIATPVEADYLFVGTSLQGAEKSQASWNLTFRLQELARA